MEVCSPPRPTSFPRNTAGCYRTFVLDMGFLLAQHEPSRRVTRSARSEKTGPILRHVHPIAFPRG